MKLTTKKLFAKTLPLLIATSICTSCAYFNHNFHPIKEGHIYRSAQINHEPLEELIKKYEIKTIINLRGENKIHDWYKDEISICKKYSIKHYDIDFSAKKLPKKKELLKLFEAFDTAEYPLLLHCMSGADRTGLASVIYELQYEAKTLKESLKQLSFFRYGHLPNDIDDFFKLYEKFNKGRDLRTWVEEDYDKIKYEEYLK